MTYIKDGVGIEGDIGRWRNEAPVRMAEHVCHRCNLGWRYTSDCCHGAELYRAARITLGGTAFTQAAEQHGRNALLFRIQGLICLISMVGQRLGEPTDLLVIV